MTLETSMGRVSWHELRSMNFFADMQTYRHTDFFMHKKKNIYPQYLTTSYRLISCNRLVTRAPSIISFDSFPFSARLCFTAAGVSVGAGSSPQKSLVLPNDMKNLRGVCSAMSSSTSTQKSACSNKDSPLKKILREDIYPTLDNPQVLVGQQMPEYPSSRMEYKFQLQNYIDPHDLQRSFQDMKIGSEGHTMTIIGIPPDNDFDEHSILAVLQKYDLGPTFISCTALS